jgi:hypothetical protein
MCEVATTLPVSSVPRQQGQVVPQTVQNPCAQRCADLVDVVVGRVVV